MSNLPSHTRRAGQSSNANAATPSSSDSTAAKAAEDQQALNRMQVSNRLAANLGSQAGNAVDLEEKIAKFESAIKFNKAAREISASDSSELIEAKRSTIKLGVALHSNFANAYQAAADAAGDGTREQIEHLKKCLALFERVEVLLNSTPDPDSSKTMQKSLTRSLLNTHSNLSSAQFERAISRASLKDVKMADDGSFDNGTDAVLPLLEAALHHMNEAITCAEKAFSPQELRQFMQKARVNLWKCQEKEADALRDMKIAGANQFLEKLEHLMNEALKSGQPLPATPTSDLDSGGVNQYQAMRRSTLDRCAQSLERNKKLLELSNKFVQGKNYFPKDSELPETIKLNILKTRGRIVADTFLAHSQAVFSMQIELEIKKQLNLLPVLDAVALNWLDDHIDWFNVSDASMDKVLQLSGWKNEFPFNERKQIFESLLLKLDENVEQGRDVLQMLGQESSTHRDFAEIIDGMISMRDHIKAELAYQIDAENKTNKPKADSAKEKPARLLIAQTRSDGRIIGELEGGMLAVKPGNGPTIYYVSKDNKQTWERFDAALELEAEDAHDLGDSEAGLEGAQPDAAQKLVQETRKLEKRMQTGQENADKLHLDAGKKFSLAFDGYAALPETAKSIDPLLKIFEIAVDQEIRAEKILKRLQHAIHNASPEAQDHFKKRAEEIDAKLADIQSVLASQREAHEHHIARTERDGALVYLLEQGKLNNAVQTLDREKLAGVVQVIGGKAVKMNDFMDEILADVAGLDNAEKRRTIHVHFRDDQAPIEQNSHAHLIVKDASGATAFRPPLRLSTLQKLYGLVGGTANR